MKKLLTICLMLAMSCSFAFAQETTKSVEPAPATEEQSVDGPTAEFETIELNYGDIEQGSDPYRYFRFSNTGNAPLVIKHAKGSCGCTVPSYQKEPIMPGESSEIKVRYDTNRVGPFSKSITLTTNVENDKDGKITLRIKGKVSKAPEEPAAMPENDANPFNNGK